MTINFPHIVSNAGSTLFAARLSLVPSTTFTLLVLAIGCRPAPSEQADPHPASQAKQDSDGASSSSPAIPVTDTSTLRTRIGQRVVVVGQVSRIGKSNSGHRFINFQGSRDFSVFISRDDVSAFKPGPPETLYADKRIEVSGTLELHRNKPQISVRTPAAITVAAPKRGPPQQPEKPEPVELKRIGADQWVSPAGLHYRGRDPDGRPRREHVLRHARDIPDRDGPHGVFDGGDELTFAWIDAAWQRIRKTGLEPEIQGDRVTYLVPMGQRVGYLGGATGARRGHPALTRIFLVMQRGTTNVITAFPR